jgi:hypothetical protein
MGPPEREGVMFGKTDKYTLVLNEDQLTLLREALEAKRSDYGKAMTDLAKAIGKWDIKDKDMARLDYLSGETANILRQLR